MLTVVGPKLSLQVWDAQQCTAALMCSGTCEVQESRLLQGMSVCALSSQRLSATGSLV